LANATVNIKREQDKNSNNLKFRQRMEKYSKERFHHEVAPGRNKEGLGLEYSRTCRSSKKMGLLRSLVIEKGGTDHREDAT